MPVELGRFHRQRVLGTGAFATVWLYRDTSLDSLVAVKALADNWSQRADVRERFLQEARMLRRADSAHVVSIYDLGETDDGTPYFVMSYADAGTVADLLPGVPLPLTDVVDLVSQAGDGLAALHRQGVIHRDIKPQNLLLRAVHPGARSAEPTLRLEVADLGVAKAQALASGLTQVVGTAAYMAPEQATPGAGLGCAADQHALAAVAYHLLTGRPVRIGAVSSVGGHDEWVPPSAVGPELPPKGDEGLAHGAATDPDDRWPDVITFVDALTAAAAGSRAAPQGPVARSAPAAVASADPPVDRPRPLEPAASAAGASAPRARRGSVLSWSLGVGVVLLVALLLSGGLLVDRHPDGTAPRAGRGKQPHVATAASALAGVLPHGWVETAHTASGVRYTNGGRGLMVGLDTRRLSASPKHSAQAALSSYADTEGYALLVDAPMPHGTRDGWRKGWQVSFRYEVAGVTRRKTLWFVGNPTTTVASVVSSVPKIRVRLIPSLMSRGLTSLRQSAT